MTSVFKGYQPKSKNLATRLMGALAFIIVFLIAAVSAHGQTVVVSATHFGGLSPITGNIYFQAALPNGIPVSLPIPGGGGISTTDPYIAAITNGVFSVTLPDVSVGSTTNVCFLVTAFSGARSLLGPGFTCLQPHGTAVSVSDWCQAGVCNFDNYTPGLSPWALTQIGPTGPAGPPGAGLPGPPATARGPWSSAATYAIGDSVGYLGSSYVALTANGPTATAPVVGSIWGLQAAAGATGPAGVASLQQLASIRTRLPAPLNLFDSTQDTTGNYVSGTTGNLVVNASYTASGYIVANSGGTMITSAAISNGTVGYAFYDQSFTFISGSVTTVAAGGTFSVPATAAFVRISLLNAAVATEMVSNGTTLPATYIRFASIQTSDINAGVTLAQALVAAKFTGGSNLFNAAGITTGILKATDGTIDATQTAYRTSNFMYVGGQSSIISSSPFGGTGTFYGTAFYDINFAFISGTTTAQAASTPIAIPSTAAYCRFYYNPTAVASYVGNILVVAGSTLPGSYDSFGLTTYPTAASSASIQSVVNAALPTTRNLFNPAAVTAGVVVRESDGAVVTLAGIDVSAPIPVTAGSTYTIAAAIGCSPSSYGSAFYDAAGNFVAGGPACPIAAGTNFTVPASASQFRFSIFPAGLATQMLTLGTTAPSPFVSFSPNGASVSSSYGKVIGIWGDSITQVYSGTWVPTVLARSGTIQTFQDAHMGRPFSAIFENYGGTATGTNLGSGGPAPNNGTLGNTIAQDIAGLDGLLIELGTNDTSVTLGAPGDAATAATEYGYIRAAIEGILAAKPTIHLAIIAPYNTQTHTGTAQLNVIDAIKYVAGLYGVPVLDSYRKSGINQFNWSITLQSDGTHPLPLGGTQFFGPAVGEFVKTLF